MNCPSCGQENRDVAEFCDTCGTNLDPPITTEDRRVLSGGFVGRHQEMADLKTALEDAISGRGRLVMLVGEPGIGKS